MQYNSFSTQQTFFQKLRSLDYLLLICILLLGLISSFTMYSTDGGEFLLHSKSHASKFFNFWKKVGWVVNVLYFIYALVIFLILACFLSLCLSTINLKSFFAIGAAAELPDPPCSITILIAYLGFLYGPKAIYNAWSLSL